MIKSLPFNVTIKTRLYGLLAMLAVLMGLIGAVGLAGTRESNADLHEIYDRGLLPHDQIATIATLTREVALAVDKALFTGDRRAKANARATIRMLREEVMQAWEEYEKIPKSAQEERLAQEMWRRRAEFVAVDDRIFEAFAQGDMAMARRIRVDELQEATDAFGQASKELMAYQRDQAAEAAATAQRRYVRNLALITGMLVLGVLASAGLGWVLAQYILNSLSTCVRVARDIAQGKLGHRVETNAQDEIAEVLGGLNVMDEKLHGVVSEVLSAARAVGEAADQLMQGNDDLSQRTQEQASALEETAASMEQMSATVKQNADNAQRANRLAEEARAQAEKGSAVVQHAISGMEEITAASRKIGEIISVIDEIAFQTNLLALNAAVEAARAGEQGRGFAVVATEVRNLAQRSASAAKETKELINASLGKVKSGSELVDASGGALHEIRESVRKVSDLVAEIAAASSEQASGVDQVNHAVTQMDETTQQNAALVEEAAAASKALQQQSQQLLAYMAFFAERGGERIESVRSQPAAAFDAEPARSARAA